LQIATLHLLFGPAARSADRFNILEYGLPNQKVDRTGSQDASLALTAAVNAANLLTAKGLPACVYIPPGIYRISVSPPAFQRAGCIIGDGPSQSIIRVDPQLDGDLFVWEEAWAATTAGPTVVGIQILGSRSTTKFQNALMFYGRNDEVFIDNVSVSGLHGRALAAGVSKNPAQSYMRESHMRSVRFFNDGAPGIPVLELSSSGIGRVDGTNEIRISQIDIYGSHGPSLVIRNNSSGVVRDITIDSMRIEGLEDGSTAADLLTIGDAFESGTVKNIMLTNVELIDPPRNFAAIRLTAPNGESAPSQVTFQGMIGGGLPRGQGLRIDAGRYSTFRFSAIHTLDTNVIIGSGISNVLLEGGGGESNWTYKIAPNSVNEVLTPLLRRGYASHVENEIR
jgi:hypothetical protein